MTYKELLEGIAEGYGLFLRLTDEGSYEVTVPEVEDIKGLRKELESYGFKVRNIYRYPIPGFFKEWHINPPTGGKYSRDKGWDWEVGTTSYGGTE